MFSIFRRERKICVVQNLYTDTGLFACFLGVLAGIAYADRKAMLPVIDMKSVKNAYLYDDEVGNVNAWEYYFKQPVEISLDEAYHSESYTTRATFLCPCPRQYTPFFYNQDGQLDYWRCICRKYIKLQPEVLTRLKRMKAKYKGMKLLGVKVRGTDYITTQPHDHPISATAEQVIHKAMEVMQGNNFDAVYLSTEDKKVVAKFQKAFGEKLLLPEAEYIDYDYSNKDKDNWITNYGNDRENDKYFNGMEYLVSILFLSTCKGFITSINCGAVGVMLFSQGFEYLYVFDLGRYS